MLKLATRIGLIAVALSALAVTPSMAACSGSANQGTLVNGTPKAGSVDDGDINVYKITVPANKQGELVLEGPNGDIDLTVKTCGGDEVCFSHNQVPLPDACVSDGTATDLQDVGPGLAPGDYKVYINACWSSEDAEDCDYGDPLGNGSGAPGALDPLPPVQYVIAFSAV